VGNGLLDVGSDNANGGIKQLDQRGHQVRRGFLDHRQARVLAGNLRQVAQCAVKVFHMLFTAHSGSRRGWCGVGALARCRGFRELAHGL